MKTLTFADTAISHNGKSVRLARFQERSTLPVAATCLVANAMRETLSYLAKTAVHVRLFEPVMPDDEKWSVIARDASMFRVRGPAMDAAIVLRPKDGVALASLLFGEAERDERDLSILERTVVTRALHALAGALSPVCGFREQPQAEPILDIRGYATYFEVVVERPVRTRIGIALARDPVFAAAGASLRPEDLLDVEVELHVELAQGDVDAASLLALGEGACVPMTSRVGDDGILMAGTTVIGRGECGAHGSRAAMIVRLPANGVLR
ncbi:MAG: FliM/FliN family flagellar motor switch protein [Candidatus Eremiobacteraeota bacterium]|nr:FliM/FliN family flagellar motor switch protein [Candidatus Eremiobacteraeota bacterium]